MKIYTHFNTLLVRGMIYSKKKILLSLVTLFLLSYTSFSQVNIVFNPTITNVTVGQTFTVDVNVQFIAGEVDAAAIFFNFDNTRLAVTSATNAPSIGILPTVALALPTPAAMNIAGRVSYVAGTASAFPTTNFTVISVTFTTLITGSTPLTFRRPPIGAPLTNATRSAISVLNGVTNGTVNISAIGCTTPTATISAAPTCDANAFNLILFAAANGTAPYDLTITSPSGTATYNDIPVGGTITNFAPPTARIWPAPPTPPTSEDASITLGVQFQSSVTGFVKGVRFFGPDDAGIPGTFTGQLWTAGGAQLASGTFTGVVADSWNELLFTEPILIAANTTYVASYHTNAIKYVGTGGGLAAPVVNGSLTALANGGLFTYGGAVTFPVSATANNYWADVIFSANNYTFNLTTVKDALECTGTGPFAPLNVTSIDCSTLPVSLINFSATPKDNAVLLRWATASEFNNLGFELQRSIDGHNGWSAIAFVNGAGNSNSTINYSYVDENLSASRYYYRLKQIDIDQRFTYSAIVSALLDGSESFGLQQNFPNPFRGETIIRFTLPQKTNINLSIFDMNGRLVKVLANGSKDSGTHAVTLNSGILSSGLYYYKLQAGDFSAVKKLTVR